MSWSKNRTIQGRLFRCGNLNSFDTQSANGVLHQMHASDGVMKTSVMDPRIDQIRKPHLGNTPQTLKITVLDQIED